MPLREDLLNPIPGENPGGQNLRFDPVYDKIKEARREDDDANQGEWKHERKVADWPTVIKLAQESIATRSKDVQLAAWLIEALLKYEGFQGFADGLVFCRGLLEKFWDNLYPPLDDGDMEMRAAPINWMGSRLEVAVRTAPLCRDGYGYLKWKESRNLGYEDAAKTKEQKTAREKLLKEGKLAPEIFDKSFGETPKSFYAQQEKDLDASLAALTAFDRVCQDKFTDEAPALGKLKTAIEEVRHAVHGFLQKKREVEPDPVETPEPAPPTEQHSDDQAAAPAQGEAMVPMRVPVHVATEPPDRAEAVANIVAAAAFLRKREPTSPAAYLMLRGLRWGELRATSNPMELEAPPTEVRQHIKNLATNRRWRDLLESAEQVMALPCSRAWLDLQRFVVEACVALGDDYYKIAVAIRSELRTLLRDLPELLDATLNDDTAAANAETQTWLRDLVSEPADAPPRPKLLNAPLLDASPNGGWRQKFQDPHALAVDALRSGRPQSAIDILNEEMERQRSGRGRFQRKLQLAQMCVAAGKDAIAQPLLDDLAASIETHKLEEWEDRETIAAALAFLLQASKKIQGDAKLKATMFDRICRLDPVRALEV